MIQCSDPSTCVDYNGKFVINPSEFRIDKTKRLHVLENWNQVGKKVYICDQDSNVREYEISKVAYSKIERKLSWYDVFGACVGEPKVKKSQQIEDSDLRNYIKRKMTGIAEKSYSHRNISIPYRFYYDDTIVFTCKESGCIDYKIEIKIQPVQKK